MRRSKEGCPCGQCHNNSPHKAGYAKGNVRNCPATDMELALIAKARRLTGPKLAAMMPAWLKRELASKLPRPIAFVPDKAPVYPTISRQCVATKQPGPDPFGNDPRTYYPYLREDMTTAQYVKQYEKLTGLRS